MGADVVAIEASWLAIYAAPLCSLSPPLQDPPPFYDRDGDRLMAFVSGTIGPHSWSLPVTAVPFPDCEDRFKWFAYFLLQGDVDERLQQFACHLLSHPRILFKPWIRLQPAMLALVHSLRLKGVSTRVHLQRQWRTEPMCE